MKTLSREVDKQEIVGRLAGLRPDSPRQWGRMSPHQMICHLNDSFRVATGERPVNATASGAKMVLQRTVVKAIALWVPLRWPRGLPTMPDVDQERRGTRPTAFADDLADLLSLIDKVTRQRFEGTTHPFFGPMSMTDWLRWGYLHVDHHLRQFGL